MNMVKLHGKPIRVNKASQDKKSQDVGANLFIGNLDEQVDEKILYDTFSAFGVIVQTPKVRARPPARPPAPFPPSREHAPAASALWGKFVLRGQVRET
jgi:RNA recognition motif-containing protein